LQSGEIKKFHSFLTGELFALLREKGALAAVTNGPADDEIAFADGVRAGSRHDVFASLFSIRAGVLLDAFAAGQASSRLSGLLIGGEWSAARSLGASAAAPVHIIASPALASRYARAASVLGFSVVVHDPDACYVRAIEELAIHD